MDLSNRVAPEHLELAVAEPEALLPRVRNAGAVFLGRYTPEVIGDYVGGPNHVLPTARSARFSSGLSVLDFLKRTTLLALGAEQLAALAGPAQIEAIDMGRRGLHNDGAQLLIDRLAGKIEMDFATARRLFTLVCVLYWRG